MPETVRYIIIDGAAGSGHTIVARELVRELTDTDHICIQESFRSPLKHFIATALGERVERIPMDSPVAVLGGMEPKWLVDRMRHLLLDNCGEDVLGKLLVHRVLRMVRLPSFVVCADATAIDVEALPNRFIVRVERGDCDYRFVLGGCNYVFDNNGDLANLWAGVAKLAMAIRGEEKR